MERIAFWLVFIAGCGAFVALLTWIWMKAFDMFLRLIELHNEFLQFLLSKWREEQHERDMAELAKWENSPEAARQRMEKGDDAE